MSVRFNGDGVDDLDVVLSGMTAQTGTAMCWGRIVTDRDAYSTFLQMTNSSDHMIQTNTDGTTLIYYALSQITGNAMTVGQWHHLAARFTPAASGTVELFLDGVEVGTQITSISGTWDRIRVGDSQFVEPLNGRVGCIKVWNRALTDAQIAAEMRQYEPLEWRDIKAFYPILPGERTRSYISQIGDFTDNGTNTDEEGPPIPWRRGRARLIIPASVGGTTHEGSVSLGLSKSVTQSPDLAWAGSISAGLSQGLSSSPAVDWAGSITPGLTVGLSSSVLAVWEGAAAVGLTAGASTAGGLVAEGTIAVGLVGDISTARDYIAEGTITAGLSLDLTDAVTWVAEVSIAPGVSLGVTSDGVIVGATTHEGSIALGLTQDISDSVDVIWDGTISAGLSQQASVAANVDWAGAITPGLTVDTVTIGGLVLEGTATVALSQSVTMLGGFVAEGTISLGLTQDLTDSVLATWGGAVSLGLSQDVNSSVTWTIEAPITIALEIDTAGFAGNPVFATAAFGSRLGVSMLADRNWEDPGDSVSDIWNEESEVTKTWTEDASRSDSWS